MTVVRIFLIALVTSSPVWGCINADGTDIDGESVEDGVGPSYAKLIRKSMDSSPEERFRAMTRYRNGKDDDEFTESELEGVEAIYMGRHDEALAIFKEIEAVGPGRYSTAANMGTAYELKGDLALALKWISEGIRRNPDSHHGTEWLHVAILKTKIRLKENPDHLVNNPIIGLPAKLSNARIPVDGNDHSVAEIGEALRYQLKERAVFVKPQDPVMADLLFTYGMYEARVRTIESGIRLLELSREYGYPDKKRLDETLGHYESLILHRKLRTAAWYLLGILGFLTFLAIAYRNKWFFLSQSAYRRHHANTSTS